MLRSRDLPARLSRALGARALCSLSGGFGHTLDAAPGGFYTLTLSRPEVHNAFSDRTIAALDATLTSLGSQQTGAGSSTPPLRCLTIRGLGTSFCAGADLEWMRRASEYTAEQNRADALALSRMLHKLAMLPCVTISLVNGAAVGGGVGIVAASDVSVALRTAKFALAEAKLGLIPATISPYVIRRMGEAQAGRYFLTAETFDAHRAQRIGLVHELADDLQDLDRWGETLEESLVPANPRPPTPGPRHRLPPEPEF